MRRFLRLTVALALLSQAAWAEPTEAEKQEAEARFAEGMSLYAAGKVEDARTKFAQAYTVLRRVNILWNLAVAEANAERPVEALRHFRAYVHSAGADPKDVKQALEKFIPPLEKRTSRIRVEIPDGAEISVDGEVMGTSPFIKLIDVAPGPHRVQARNQRAILAVDVNAPVGDTVLARIPLPEERPKDERSHEPPRETNKGKVLTVAILGGVALGTASAGLVFALDSQGKKDDVDALRREGACLSPSSLACGDYKSKIDAGQTSATLSTILYVTAGVSAAGALAAFLFWPKGDPKPETGKMHVVPTLGAGHAGMGVVGRF